MWLRDEQSGARYQFDWVTHRRVTHVPTPQERLATLIGSRPGTPGAGGEPTSPAAGRTVLGARWEEAVARGGSDPADVVIDADDGGLLLEPTGSTAASESSAGGAGGPTITRLPVTSRQTGTRGPSRLSSEGLRRRGVAGWPMCSAMRTPRCSVRPPRRRHPHARDGQPAQPA